VVEGQARSVHPEITECVVNISEGRDEEALATLAEAAGEALLDLHRDPDHHRSVLTLGGPAESVAQAARALARATLRTLDLRAHAGAHPRLGVLDVVPFVPYAPGNAPPVDLAGAIRQRDEFARWLGTELGVPCFLYGPLPNGEERTLPEVRRLAFGAGSGASGTRVMPDYGPALADPRVGATAVGARRVLVAYNVWVSSLEVARRVAPLVRRPEVRALALAVGERAQVSCNLLDPGSCGPATLYDQVAALVAEGGGAAEGGELVGLVPEVVLATVPTNRWAELGLDEEATVEAQLRRRRRSGAPSSEARS
jgi:glutamate formiminotransferase